MSLQDWKKIRKNQWRNKRKGGNIFFHDYSKLNESNPYWVSIIEEVDSEGYGTTDVKKFSDEDEALSFLQNYMRNH
jgi:hypothetical protein